MVFKPHRAYSIQQNEKNKTDTYDNTSVNDEGIE